MPIWTWTILLQESAPNHPGKRFEGNAQVEGTTIAMVLPQLRRQHIIWNIVLSDAAVIRVRRKHLDMLATSSWRLQWRLAAFLLFISTEVCVVSLSLTLASVTIEFFCCKILTAGFAKSWRSSLFHLFTPLRIRNGENSSNGMLRCSTIQH